MRNTAVIKTLPQPTTEETKLPHPAQGAWTYEDYLRLPDDGQRYEIINGVLYMASAPSYIHQYVVTKIGRYLDEFAEQAELGVVLTAPFDVRLPGNRGVIQPDILFIRTENLPHPSITAFQGVPDLVVEVLSPSTRRYDSSLKLDAYEQAGVKEYWLVDPIAQFVLVYALPQAEAGAEAGQEYLLAGEFTAQDELTSPLLPGFRLLVASVLP
jgi:Uma2 family endonuclease